LVRIPRSPVALELTYLADRATFTSGGSEFVEGIRVALVLDRILPARPAPASRSTSRRAVDRVALERAAAP
jgi:hypothetical protein